MKKPLLLTILIVALSQLITFAQTGDYYEYINHENPFRDYSNFMPISEKGAYVVRNASLIKIEGTKETVIYQSNWGQVRSNFFINGQDTVVFFYDFFDLDIGTDEVTKITINQDSVQILNDVDEDCNNACLRAYVYDFVQDSLGQFIMASEDGFFVVDDNLDTLQLSDEGLPFSSKFFKNSNEDLFLIDRNIAYRIDENYNLIQLFDAEEFIIKAVGLESSLYLLFKDRIEVYDSELDQLIDNINLDSQFGDAIDLTFNDKGQILLLQNDDEKTSRAFVYEMDGSYELIYEENLKFTTYNKIKCIGDRVFCIGDNKAVPILKSQAMEWAQPFGNPDLRIDAIEITLDSTVASNCSYFCIDYYYDLKFTVTSLGADTVRNYNIANFRYPIDFSFSFNSLKWNFGYDANVGDGQTHIGLADFDTQWRYGAMTFEIIGANFLPDRNPENSIFTSNDIIAGISHSIPVLENVSIYPQPANQIVNIKAPENITLVQVYSMDGQLRYATQSRTNINSIEVSDIPAGIYMIQMWSANKSKVAIKKLILQ